MVPVRIVRISISLVVPQQDSKFRVFVSRFLGRRHTHTLAPRSVVSWNGSRTLRFLPESLPNHFPNPTQPNPTTTPLLLPSSCDDEASNSRINQNNLFFGEHPPPTDEGERLAPPSLASLYSRRGETKAGGSLLGDDHAWIGKKLCCGQHQPTSQPANQPATLVPFEASNEQEAQRGSRPSTLLPGLTTATSVFRDRNLQPGETRGLEPICSWCDPCCHPSLPLLPLLLLLPLLVLRTWRPSTRSRPPPRTTSYITHMSLAPNNRTGGGTTSTTIIIAGPPVRRRTPTAVTTVGAEAVTLSIVRAV